MIITRKVETLADINMTTFEHVLCASYVFKFPAYNLSTIVVPFYHRIIELKNNMTDLL